MESFKRYIIISLVLFAVIFTSHIWLSEKASKKDKNLYIPPPQHLKHFTFGYRESIADSLWVRLIQDMEVCGKKTVTRKEFEESIKNLAAVEVNRTQTEVVQTENAQVDSSVFNINWSEKICVKGWAFQLLDAVTELAPRFRMAYSAGATSLSVLNNDYWGAKIIFDKGVQQFPNDWPILYRAAYHYLYEFRDLATAADLLRRAGENGAPIWVKSLAARLYTRTGQAILGLTLLKQYIQFISKGEQRDQVAERIRKLEDLIRSSQ